MNKNLNLKNTNSNGHINKKVKIFKKGKNNINKKESDYVADNQTQVRGIKQIINKIINTKKSNSQNNYTTKKVKKQPLLKTNTITLVTVALITLMFTIFKFILDFLFESINVFFVVKEGITMIILTIMKNFILVSVNCFLLYLAISFIIDVITEQDTKNRNITNKNKIKKINKEKKQKKKLSKIIISLLVVILMVLNISSEYYKYNVTKQQQEQKKIEQEKQQKEKEKEEQERLLKEKKEENQRLLEKQKESLKQAKQEYSKYILEYKNDSYDDIDDMTYYLYDYNLVITKDDTNRTVTFNLVNSDTNKIVETYTKEYNKKDLS